MINQSMSSEKFVRKRDEGTIVHVFHRWVAGTPRKTAMLEKKDGRWVPVSWRECGEWVAAIAFGLKALGIGKGDRVALFSENRIEWTFADLATLALGAVTVPIYASSSPEQLRYIVDHSGARAIFVNSAAMAEKMARIRDRLPGLEKVIIFSPAGEKKNYDLSLEALCRLGLEHAASQELKDLYRELAPEDLATIMYTPGTTGPPKGCMLSHDNIIYICQSIAHILPLRRKDLVFSFLPLAHAMERNGGQFISIYFGLPTAYASSLEAVDEEMRAVRPTFSRAVPRFFEKAYHRLQATVNGYSPPKRAVFKWALKVGKTYHTLKQEKRSIPAVLRLKRAMADFLVYRKIRDTMGGRLRFFVSGGAPLAKEIIEFFSALGVLVTEGYGLTETTVIASINRLDRYRFGTVGFPIPGAEIKIAADGEILIRHDGVFKGYYKNEAATREVLDEDGWFHSGDIGYFNEEGFLVISDRKKDLIITAGGKNVAPQNLENALKAHPLISQVMVYGDRKPYLVALVTLDAESLPEQAARFGITLDPAVPYSQNPAIWHLIDDFIKEKNWAFSRAEMIKKFVILNEDFNPDLGEITPTAKVKRNAIVNRYMDLIESMYAAEDIEGEIAG